MSSFLTMSASQRGIRIVGLAFFLAGASTGQAILQQSYVKASNAQEGDSFGQACAVSGDTMVIGAPSEGSSATGVDGDQSNNGASLSGSAYVFVRIGGAWVQQAYLKASNTGSADAFGRAVAIDGDTIVVGAWMEDSAAVGVDGNQADNTAQAAGAAYVFVREHGQWSQQAYLKACNTNAGDLFGCSVAVSGDTIVIGAFDEDSAADGVNGNEADNSAPLAGAAYVFVREANTWSQQAYLKASHSSASDVFGTAVAVSGDTIVVGASGEDSAATGINGNESNNSASSSGAAYVFVRNGVEWSQQAYLKASNTGTSDLFGSVLAIDLDTIVIGAIQEASTATGVDGDGTDDSAFASGAAYVFARDGTAWSQQAYLKASNTDAGDDFGRSVSVDGDIVAVGAAWESSAATGIDGDQSDNSAERAGAVYVFSRSSETWAPRSYVKASNTGADDRFGHTVAVDAGRLVVGAWSEDSASVGVGGSQSGNGASTSGAAYALATCFAGWSLYGEGNPGSTGVPGLQIDTDPVLGATLQFELSNATFEVVPGMVVLGFAPAAADLSPLGIQTKLLVVPVATPALLLGPNGGSTPCPIPNDPLLCGAEVFGQGLHFDPGAVGTIAFSRGVRLLVGL